MEHESEYVGILLESLKKKKQVLTHIMEYTDEQEKLIAKDKFDVEAFGKLVERKAECIDTLTHLDSGFQKIFDRVKAVFEISREQYTEQIAVMQELIPEIMKLSMSIQTREAANKAVIEKQFLSVKKDIYTVKNTQKVTRDYYNAMNKINLIDPQFLDKRN
ncbi:MAG: flagellar export chaperone FlgN [Lachnospiraceae bacterium]|nr:flagellar export chaperone FlgN [Lachnospiraceae bacterium]